jgi:hypothetical protein
MWRLCTEMEIVTRQGVFVVFIIDGYTVAVRCATAIKALYSLMEDPEKTTDPWQVINKLYLYRTLPSTRPLT